MEPASRSLDLRPSRPVGPRNTSSTTFTPQKGPPQGGGPSLTTEYTPRDRNGSIKPSGAPQASSQTPQPSSSVPPSESQPRTDDGPDPSTLPPVTAPPSHPSIDPSQPGIVEGRPVFEVDIANLAEKGWRRPGSDLSDWFNYGFDEISWEAYCYRRREMGEAASVLKTNVVNFSGMPEDQLTQLPPELRQMVMAGTNAMMNNSGVPNGQMMQGMMGPGDMNNMGGMGNMNMQMMNPMMVGMGEMGMDGGQPQGQPQEGMQGMGPGVGMNGEGFGPQGGPQNMGMGAMGMPGEYGMQDPNAMQQQMYQNMEVQVPQQPPPVQPSAGPGMIQGPQGPRAVPQGPYRGGRGMGMRGARGGFPGRGRGGPPIPIRPASPLPPNVPTGPRNQNKYKDRDNNAPAVEGLDYGGGQERGSRTPTDGEDRSSRKRRDRSPSDDRRDSKRR
ncbi:hypothetical protein OF83DRAFT_1160849 [Amylostereum chailletii]|nr:hypothetical protein OF83DRAFT_1160849 [Amylostereum chailletii]